MAFYAVSRVIASVVDSGARNGDCAVASGVGVGAGAGVEGGGDVDAPAANAGTRIEALKNVGVGNVAPPKSCGIVCQRRPRANTHGGGSSGHKRAIT